MDDSPGTIKKATLIIAWFLSQNGSELPTEEQLAAVPCILPSWSSLGDLTRARFGLGWYPSWVQRQLAATPPALLSLFLGVDKESTAQAFMNIWSTLAIYLSKHPGTSINEVVRHLQVDGLIPDTDEKTQQQCRSLVFTLIGWQTMLFRGDSGSCPPTQFAIADETSGYRGSAHMKLTQSQTYSREPLEKLLLQFGVMLPPKNYDLSQRPEHKQAFTSLREIDTGIVNASLLVQVGRFELVWTDSLACHLELDLANSRLYLFRYPSFCIANMATRVTGDKEKTVASPIYSCALRDAVSAPWAKAADIADLLEEILISYRLLFGQHKKSRKFFRQLSPFQGLPAAAQDTVLLQLCGRKHPDVPFLRAERKRWELSHDFPILRCRLSTLAYEMSIRKPRQWSQLWADKRDSAQWATFWMVLIFGGISIWLSIIQIVLQGIQTFQ